MKEQLLNKVENIVAKGEMFFFYLNIFNKSSLLLVHQKAPVYGERLTIFHMWTHFDTTAGLTCPLIQTTSDALISFTKK